MPETPKKPARKGVKPRSARKSPVKHCEAGHCQSTAWRPAHGCVTCQIEERRKTREVAAAEEREAWSRLLNVGPVLSIKTVSTGRTRYFTIPKSLRRPSRRRAV